MLSASISACSDEEAPIVVPEPVQATTVDIRIVPSPFDVVRNEERPFRVMATLIGGVQQDVTYNSSIAIKDQRIAALTSKKILGVQAGTTSMTATYEGKSISVPVIVELPPIIRFRVQPDPVSLRAINIGESSEYRVFILRRDAAEEEITRNTTWTSSNPGIVATQPGVITGRAIGQASVTVTWGDYSERIDLAVTQ